MAQLCYESPSSYFRPYPDSISVPDSMYFYQPIELEPTPPTVLEPSLVIWVGLDVFDNQIL